MNRLITTGRILAILTILVGIAHEVMTFHSMIAEGFIGLDTAWQQTFTYFSLGCGGLLILCGLLFLMLLGRVERHEFLVAPLVTIGVFAVADGILAVCYMFANPFAWVVLGLGIGLFLIAMSIRSKHRKQ
jgi:hypothetical protein